MNELSNLERLQQREYSYAVTRKDSNFIVVIEELSLIATGSSLEECIVMIDQKKEALFKTFAALKRADSLPMPRDASSTISPSISRSESSLGFTQFLMRSAMIAIIVCIGMSLFGLVVAKQITKHVNYATISNATTRATIDILEDLGSPRGPAWKRSMENLREARSRYLEVMDILDAPDEKKQCPEK